MSLKTSRLLHRSGRNQFGDPGDPPLPLYQQSPESLAYDNRMIGAHRALNDIFAQTHRQRWLTLFAGASKRDAWIKLHPYGKPALGTFYSMARECGSFEDFLTWWLVCHKHQALRLLGYDTSSIHEHLLKFAECGRYYVTYGNCARTFGTAS